MSAQSSPNHYDVLVLGAGAAGLMCAMQAGKRGKRVLLIDHSKKMAEKIRISGGGRCNFTNMGVGPQAYLSQNKHFFKSALRQYTQHDFIALVDAHDIAYHEKTLGQLFCDKSAQQIIDMMVDECNEAGVSIQMQTQVETVLCENDVYYVRTNVGTYNAPSLVVATGGLSIPKIGATPFGYQLAEQFGLSIIPPRAGLVPLTFQDDMLTFCRGLSGVSVDAVVTCGKTSFREGLLFTHRGLSGPSILQISSYWQSGQTITINLAPDTDVLAFLKARKDKTPKQEIQTVLTDILPKKLVQGLCARADVQGRLADLSHKLLHKIAAHINAWDVVPSGTEGYRTAEVTLGGVDTECLSSKTMEAKQQKGLYFIGEVVDVTGHLGGYNFQWAWSSGYVAGQHV